MTEEEVNSAVVKPVAITASILGLIQGIAWTVFSILCICCYTGGIVVDPVVNFTSTEYYRIIYVIFLDSNGNDKNDLLVQPKQFFIFMWFYLALSVLWMIVSGSVMWAMIQNQWHLTKYLFGAWSTLTILISLVDVTLVALIARDYDRIRNTLEGSIVLNTYLLCYGIIMSIAARGYILWIINVIFVILMTKYQIDIIKKENKEIMMPIIHGYEGSDSRSNPPWFNNSVKDFWAEHTSQNSPRVNTEYDNDGFKRSQSFFPAATAPEMRERNAEPPPHNSSNNNLPQNSFTASIINKVATIGKNKGRRSPLNRIPPPIIPDPDYTPPGTLNGLKSVLKSKSNY